MKPKANVDDPGALLPPELWLNETMPTQAIQYYGTSNDFFYSDDEDNDVVQVDEDGFSIEDMEERVAIE